MVLAAGWASGCAAPAGARPYWPGRQGWAGAGLDDRPREDLRLALDHALQDNTASVLVIRDGLVAAEGYAEGFDPADRVQLASAAKSVVALLVGIAIDQGAIRSVDQSAADFVPAWRNTPREAIRIRHLLSMTSGMTDEGLSVRNVDGDQFAINAAAPLRYEPGTHWRYASAIYHLLFHILSAATGTSLEAFARNTLLDPIGAASFEWVTDQVETERGPRTNYYTGLSSARDLARIGLLVARGGEWRGRRVVSTQYLQACLSPSQPHNPAYGWLWWLNRESGHAARPGPPVHRFPGAPRDTVAALGAGGQALLVVPSESLIVVRQGRRPSNPGLVGELLSGVRSALA